MLTGYASLVTGLADVRMYPPGVRQVPGPVLSGDDWTQSVDWARHARHRSGCRQDVLTRGPPGAGQETAGWKQYAFVGVIGSRLNSTLILAKRPRSDTVYKEKMTTTQES